MTSICKKILYNTKICKFESDRTCLFCCFDSTVVICIASNQVHKCGTSGTPVLILKIHHVRIATSLNFTQQQQQS